MVLECQGPSLPQSYLLDIRNPANYTIVQNLNDNSVLAQVLDQMSLPTTELVFIPVSDNRQLRAKFYFPPELRKEEFIEFPLILHV